MSTDSIASLLSQSRSSFLGTEAEWSEVKAHASYVIGAGGDETVYGGSDEFYDVLTALAANKEPYGAVEYADPGYQSDKKKRYPIDTEEHIRAAWNYIHKAHNGGKYSSEQLAHIKAKIVSAWKRKIDPKGPPSA